MIQREVWYREAEKWDPEEDAARPPIERKDPLPSWRDPNWLPEQVDHVQSQTLALMQAAAPPLNRILQNMGKVPHRTFLKAKYIRAELDQLSDHLDRYLDKQTLWNQGDYQRLLDEVEDIAQHVRSTYMEALPYLKGEKQVQAPLPAVQDLLNLPDLEDEQLALPGDVEEAEWEE